MPATYTYNPANPIGQLRLLIGDKLKVGGTAYFSDEELQALLDANTGVVNISGVQALRTWARAYASKPKEQIGDYTIDYGIIAKQLMTAAEALAAEIGDEADDACIGELGGELFLRF